MPTKKDNQVGNKQVLDAINSLTEAIRSKQNGNGDYVTVIDQEGVTTKIEKAQFFQMLHSNVMQLKRETTSLVEEVGKLTKGVSEDLKKHGQLESKLDSIEKSMPQTFNSWVKDKGDKAKNMVMILKLLFWLIVAMFLLGDALPRIIEFIGKVGLK